MNDMDFEARKVMEVEQGKANELISQRRKLERRGSNVA